VLLIIPVIFNSFVMLSSISFSFSYDMSLRYRPEARLQLSSHHSISFWLVLGYSSLLHMMEDQLLTRCIDQMTDQGLTSLTFGNRAQILAFATHTLLLFRNAEAILIMTYEWSLRNLK
jgi:hypothetical protein